MCGPTHHAEAGRCVVSGRIFPPRPGVCTECRPGRRAAPRPCGPGARARRPPRACGQPQRRGLLRSVRAAERKRRLYHEINSTTKTSGRRRPKHVAWKNGHACRRVRWPGETPPIPHPTGPWDLALSSYETPPIPHPPYWPAGLRVLFLWVLNHAERRESKNKSKKRCVALPDRARIALRAPTIEVTVRRCEPACALRVPGGHVAREHTEILRAQGAL